MITTDFGIAANVLSLWNDPSAPMHTAAVRGDDRRDPSTKLQRSVPERQNRRKKRRLPLPRYTGNLHDQLKNGRASATTA